MDRTAEFFGIVRQQQQGVVIEEPAATHSQFTQAAQHIGQSIHQVTCRLEQLGTLTKKSSLFHDHSTEINQLSSAIKRDVQTLNKELETLNECVGLNQISRHSSQTSTAIVQHLKVRLATTTKDFQCVLQTRTKGLVDLQKRRGQYSSELVSIKEDGYLHDRAAAVESMEKTILELGGMYKKLSTIVCMQEDVVLRIDANMDDTLEHMDKGHNELLYYLDHIGSNRTLILKVFAVLLVFLIFFMLFIA